MVGFSMHLGGGRGPQVHAWGGSSSSRSGSTSRSDSRHGRPSRRDSSPLRGLDTHFSNLMSDTMGGGRPSMFEDMPSMLGGSSSMFGRGFGSSAFSDFPGMPSGRRRSSSSCSSSDSDNDTVRPGSAYSGFPGMPGSGTRGRQTGDSGFVDRSEPFRMWRTDSNSSSSGSSFRSPSPPAPSTYGRDYRTTERAPQSTYAPGRGRSPSPEPRSQGTYRSYASRAPSPPRRHRSPSPPPRRQRSPSPVRRRHGRSTRRSPSPPPAASRHGASNRSDSARGFRTTERRPEGASSRTAGSSSHGRSRSRAAPEQPSRGQHGGGFFGGSNHSHGASQGTSHNAYNARPMPSRNSRARSPSPQARGHARDNSRASSASASASAAKPARSPAALKQIFDAYNTAWEALSRTDKAYPLPAAARELHKIDFLGGSSANQGNWSKEQILVANVQLIFLAGFGIACALIRRSDGLSVEIENRDRQTGEILALSKWLSRKEQPRWHPDRMNARTGKVGVLDEAISRKADVVAMRTAGQELLAVVGK